MTPNRDKRSEQVIDRPIRVSTHGRYVVAPSWAGGPAPLLVGFHGYAESADTQLERLRAIDGALDWLLVSVQGLHRFYRGRSEEVVASWMTRQDRELSIADNIAYVEEVLDAIGREWAVGSSLVFAGFSQGVAMAFRAGAASRRRVSGVIALGGDVPPEIDRSTLAHIPAALVGRGVKDEWYSAATFAADLQRLRESGVEVQPIEFEGGHEWSAAFNHAAGNFLGRCRSSSESLPR